MNIRTLAFLTVFFLYGLLSAQTNRFQNPLFERFAGDRELPTNELYSILEDDKGNKWIASDAGLIRITGKQVRIFTREDGLPQNVVYKLFRQGRRIWCAGAMGTLFYMENERAYSLDSLSRHIQETSDRLQDAILSMTFAEDGSLYVYYEHSKGILHIFPDLKGFEWLQTFSRKNMYLSNAPDGGSLLYGMGGKERQCENFFIDENGKQYRIDCPLEKITYGRFISLYTRSQFFLSIGPHLFVYKNGKKVCTHTLPDKILSLHAGAAEVFIGTLNGGLFLLDGQYDLHHVRSSPLSVTNILMDKEGTLWFTTLENGLYVCKNTAINILYSGDLKITGLIQTQNSVKYILGRKKIFNIDGSLYPTYVQTHGDSLTDKTGVSIIDLVFPPEQEPTREILLTDYGLYRRKSSTEPFRAIDRLRTYYRKVALGRDGAFYGAHSVLYYCSYGQYEGDSIRLNDVISNMRPYRQNLMLAGTSRNGIMLAWTKAGTICYRFCGPSVRVNEIIPLGNDSFAIATNEWGLYIADLAGRHIQKIEGTPARIQKMEKWKNDLYFATKEGLFIYDLARKVLSGFNSQNSYPFNEILDFEISRDSIWLASPSFLLKQSLASLQEPYSYPDIYIQSVFIGKNAVQDFAELEKLRHDQNDIRIQIGNPSYRYYSTSRYCYTVHDSRGHLVLSDTSRTTDIRLNLPPGRYRFSVYATDQYYLTRSASIQLSIHIRQAFYQTWWFRMLTLVSVLGLMYLIIRISIRIIRSREDKKRQLLQKVNELEAMALQSQMNPHFTFNAINSIQDYILSNKNEEAHYFLAEFARLVRMVLVHNRQKKVPVSEEVKLLRIYIGLEEQRLKDRLDFQVEYAPDLTPGNVYIPSMLLQPLVENAIWHGLRFKEGEKRILIKISRNKGYMHLYISDNGGGLKKSVSKHNSQGLQIIRERIKLLYGEDPGFDYFRIGENPGGEGVTVHIILPETDEFE